MTTRDFEDHSWRGTVSDEILEIYEAYHRPTFVGEKPAILAIDLYERVYRGGARPIREIHREFPGTCGENAWNAIEPTMKLFAVARKAGVPVIYTTGSADKKVVATKRDRGYAEPANVLEIKAELAPMPDDLVIMKNRASGFYGTPLVAHLRQMGVKSVIVCGESTSGCVRASAVDAYSYGFHVVVAEEATFDRSMISHKVSLFDLHHKYADVMHVDEIVARLESLGQAQNGA